MPVDRFFLDQEFKKGYKVVLSGDEANHIAKATRKLKGETLSIVNGRGALATCEIDSIEKKQVTVSILSVESSSPSGNRSILVQALPRLNRLDSIIEKVTELGVSEIVLFPGERSEKKELSEHQKKRVHTVIINALKQSGRLYLPKLSFIGKLSEYKRGGLKLYGDLSPSAEMISSVINSRCNAVSFFVGPESGFSENEIGILKSMAAKGVTLSENILRTDTAAIAAISIIVYLQGDFGKR